MKLSLTNNYELINWRDRIWKIGPNGKLVPKQDSKGNIIKNPLTGQPEYETIEDGTRVSANRLNHMDKGIYAAHELIVSLGSIIRRLQAQLEIDGRVPGNSGAFFDVMDGTPSRLELLTTSTDITVDVEAGATTIQVASTDGFEPFTYVTVYDGENIEHVQILSVGENELTITTLTNSYNKGAKVARSTVGINTETQEMLVGPHTVYEVELVEVV